MRLNNRISIVASGTDGIGLSKEADATVYLVNGKSECALIDAGFGNTTELICDEIQRDGYQLSDVKKIILTHGHADHAGGVLELAKRIGAKVYAMESTALAMENADMEFFSMNAAKKAGMFPDDFILKACEVYPLADGQQIKVGDLCLNAMVTEGHCAGHMSYWGDMDGVRYLFSGDAIFYHGKISVLATADSNIPMYMRTIKRLWQLKPDALLPGHGCFTLSGADKHIKKAMGYVKRLELPKNYNEDLY